MRCLGFDIGSTSIKGTILDLERRRVEAAIRSPFPGPIESLPAGHFEVRLSEILASFQVLLDELLTLAPDARHLFCSGQMGGLVLVDRHGRPLTEYVSWRDQRTLAAGKSGQSYLSEITQRWSPEVFQELGSELKPGSVTSLLYWLAENEQLREGAQPVTVADYVLGALCETAAPMDPTQALGLLKLEEVVWHHEALSALGLERLELPRLARSAEPLGQLSRAASPLTCFPSLGDQLCALRGVDLQLGELSLNVSTGSQVSCRTERFKPGRFQTRMYFAGEFLNTITHLPAGRSLNVLVDLLTELARRENVQLRNVWDQIATLAAAAPETELEADLAFFSGPMGESGSIRQITTENLSVGTLFRAAFENMTRNFVACAARIDPGGDCRRLVLSGGLTQTIPLLRQLIEQEFDRPIRDSLEGEETLTGLLEIALTWVG